MNSLAFLTNMMGADGLMIFFIILLLFGAKKLPELARGMGQAVREFNKAKDELEREITRSDVQVQPAPGQQQYMPAQLPPVSPVAAAPLAQSAVPVQPVAAVPPGVPPVEEPSHSAHS